MDRFYLFAVSFLKKRKLKTSYHYSVVKVPMQLKMLFCIFSW